MPDDAVLKAPFSMTEILGDGLPTRIDVLDVVAYAEGVPRFEPLSQLGISRVTGYDANPQAAAEAEAALPPGSRVLPHALGDGNPATLHITLYRGCSSLFEPNEEVIDMFEAISATTEGGNFRVVSKDQISTRRLDEIEECPQADFIKLMFRARSSWFLRTHSENLECRRD